MLVILFSSCYWRAQPASNENNEMKGVMQFASAYGFHANSRIKEMACQCTLSLESSNERVTASPRHSSEIGKAMPLHSKIICNYLSIYCNVHIDLYICLARLLV